MIRRSLAKYEFAENFGELVRTTRERASLTLLDVERMTGLPLVKLRAVEEGDTRLLLFDGLVLMNALGIQYPFKGEKHE